MSSSARLIVSLLIIASAEAKEVNIGAASVNLPVPDGFCELDPTNQNDAHHIKFINDAFAATSNRLIAEYVECTQLIDWRIGKRKVLDDFVQYQTELRFIDSSFPSRDAAELAKASCDYLRSSGDKTIKQTVSEANKALDQISKTIRINEGRFLGVVAEVSPVCYAAWLHNLTTDFGTQKIQVALSATTQVKGKVIYYYFFSPYVNSDTIARMLAKHRANVDAFIKANQ